MPILAEAKMIVNGECAVGYPINLPAGKTIDNVIVAYSSRPPTPDSSIAAYLAENRVNNGLGVIVVAGTNLKQVSQSGQGSISTGSISVPIVAGNVNWVHVISDDVDVQYVAITYH